MAQFDVFSNSDPATRPTVPYLLDVQTDLLGILATRLVVPLIPLPEFGMPATRLNPVVQIADEDCVLSTAEMAGIPAARLSERVASLATHRGEILAAIDFLVTGV